MDEWRDHFNLEVLGGTKERVLDMEDGREEDSTKVEVEEGTEEISREEVK